MENSKIDYLLRYISYDKYKEIIKEGNKYLLSLLEDNSYNINLNIKYLIGFGISNVEKVLLGNLELLSKENNLFLEEIDKLEEKLTRKEIIALLENAS